MRRLTLSSALTLLLLAACGTGGQTPPSSGDDAFVRAHFEECREAYRLSYGRDIKVGEVRSVMPRDVASVVSKMSWGERSVPCQLSGPVIDRPGVTDPSPIALEVLTSMPKGTTRMLFVPLGEDSSNCKTRGGGILIPYEPDSVCDEFFVDCTGVIGSGERNCPHTCVCKVECGQGAGRDCEECP